MEYISLYSTVYNYLYDMQYLHIYNRHQSYLRKLKVTTIPKDNCICRETETETPLEIYYNLQFCALNSSLSTV